MGRSPLQAALQNHLQKYYPEALAKETEMLQNDKHDDTVTETTTVSTDALEIDVEKFFKFAAACGLRDSIEEVRRNYGICDKSDRTEGSKGATAEDSEFEAKYTRDDD